MCARVCVCIHTHARTHTHAWIHGMHTNAQQHNMHTFWHDSSTTSPVWKFTNKTNSTHTCILTYTIKQGHATHLYENSQTKPISPCLFRMSRSCHPDPARLCICMCVCAYVCMRAHVSFPSVAVLTQRASAHAYLCVCVCLCVCMFVYCVCIYVCVQCTYTTINTLKS
jgi:hypothetical protein